MKLDLTLTFLELGDATSRNLGFSHCDDVWVSYGEETITETNLLEVRRRHPEHVRVRTFPKQVEAANSADWEWHIVGLRRTLRMRVQTKRLQRNGVLKVKHTVKLTGEEQRNLLIGGAVAEGMKPVYCIYCTELRRTLWKEVQAEAGFGNFETGCLLTAAEDVPGTTTRLDEIEEDCWPWHHLFAPEVEVQKEMEASAENVRKFAQTIWSQSRVPLFAVDEMAEAEDNSGWNAPSIQDPNGDTEQDFDGTGVRETALLQTCRRGEV